ncbi:MAG: hypothetical protein PF442_02355 [Desulfobulbaceae bacterium]|jgi:hypothetical protein|nr:hypothetical protein [Desulfobulbaceae bacterium]
MSAPEELQYGGYCPECKTHHELPAQPAMQAAAALFTALEENTLPLATEYLFGPARGKMFGVLVARDRTGQEQILKGFSGQHNGEWLIPGWVPPLFDVNQFTMINTPEEKRIKSLSAQLADTTCTREIQTLKAARKTRSQTLMKELHHLYILHNFKGEQRPMARFFPPDKGMPTGAGDCCAPKLIQHALQNELTPIGMAEFYFGCENRSQTRRHGHFYPPCASGCAPILGFMLCGIKG